MGLFASREREEDIPRLYSVSYDIRLNGSPKYHETAILIAAGGEDRVREVIRRFREPTDSDGRVKISNLEMVEEEGACCQGEWLFVKESEDPQYAAVKKAS